MAEGEGMSASNSVNAGSQLGFEDTLNYSCVSNPAVKTLPVGKVSVFSLCFTISLWWETFQSSLCGLCLISWITIH